ncbi:SIR2 family protein [Rubritalea sp.]|uniref:SIR2 family protein n=1 Tax=Rubritalea sp. TaxID=2109375 RepID=UPI003EF16FD3
MPKSAFEILNIRAQVCIAATPVIVLGSGASIAAGIPGMSELRDQLLSIPAPAGLEKPKADLWQKFKEILQGTDLESALQKVNLPEELDDLVVKATWDYLHPFDLNALQKLLTERSSYPLTQLFQHLLRSTNRDIDVVTPNYDRIAEYAADLGELYHETGFSYGHVRRRLGDARQAVHIKGAEQSRVNIWKVHGSFDWFRDQQGVIHALPISYACPDGWSPAIVTPGLQKYRRVYDEPFLSIKAASDRAFSNAGGFFCSGFGFNDAHIQTKLKERCRSKKVPLVLITHGLTPAAKAFFEDDFCKEYLAVEAAPDGCRIYCPEFPNGEIVSEGEFWQLESFLTLIQS